MSSYKTPPSFISASKSYSQWTTEINVWNDVTEIPGAKRGLVVALSLPIEDELLKVGIRERVFGEIDMDKLKSDNGIEELIKFLDQFYKKDDLTGAYEAWRAFDQCRRNTAQSVDEYISEFTRLNNNLKKYKIVLPATVLGFQLLEFSGLQDQDKTIVLTGVNFQTPDTLMNQMAQSLKKFFGRHSLSGMTKFAESNTAVKVEPTFQTEEVLYGNYRGRGKGRGRYTGFRISRYEGHKTKISGKNPLDAYGKTTKCRTCQSINHYERDCPDNPSKSLKEVLANETPEYTDDSDVLIAIEEKSSVEIALCNGNGVTGLLGETLGCAVLDSACSTTVCGKIWLECYLDSLTPTQRSRVKECSSDKIFKFGAGSKLNSLKRVIIPCQISTNSCRIATEVVDSDIPLLMGKPSLKKAGVVLDLINDEALFFGKKINLEVSRFGHYFIPLHSDSRFGKDEITLLTSWTEPIAQKKKIVMKLHKQFGHPSAQKLRLLLTNAGLKDPEILDEVDSFSSKCEVCAKFRKTPSRPVVAMPIATDFNEAVAMDLKVWDFKHGVYILYLIDIATRYTKARVIYSKTQDVIVENVISMWIAEGPGSPSKFLSDNGGEFSNESYTEMCENFNIRECKTAVESPWSNGLCERNHAVVDEMLKKMMLEEPGYTLEVALSWACHAKNCLLMSGGYSSYQLVFGRNPKIPHVEQDSLPALEGITQSVILAKHLSALHSSRRHFIEAETSAKIRLALRKQVRCNGDACMDGDSVYYKREKDDRWKGPAKVLAREGKILHLSHGNTTTKVHESKVARRDVEFLTANVIPRETQSVPVSESNETVGDISESSDDDNPVEQENKDPEIHVENTELRGPNDVPKRQRYVKYREVGESSWKNAKITSRAGKATGIHKYWVNLQNDGEPVKAINWKDSVEQWQYADENPETVNITINTNDPIFEAKRKELDNWKNFDVYEAVRDAGQNFMTVRWVVTEKSGYSGITHKARLVVRGFQEEEDTRCDSPTTGKEVIRILLAIGVSNGWKSHCLDVKSAFLQGQPIERDVYLLPPEEACESGNLWKLKKVVYGLKDGSRNWYFTLKSFLLNLGCSISKCDPAVFYLRQDTSVIGILLLHVDDVIWCGTDEFESIVIERIRSAFKIGKEAVESFKYLGIDLTSTDLDCQLSQEEYMSDLKEIKLQPERAKKKEERLAKDEATQLRSVVGQLNWLASTTRPDIAYSVLELSITLKSPIIQNITQANKVIRKTKTDCYSLKIPKLSSKWRIVVYSDASYGNMPDGYSSAFGYVIFLTDIYANSVPIAWKAGKIHRVVRSTLASETLALVEALDSAYYIATIIKELSGISDLKIECFVDNQSLVENVHSTKNVSEKRLRIDIAALKTMLEEKEVHKIAWIQTNLQLADSLTKNGASTYNLRQVIQSGKLNFK